MTVAELIAELQKMPQDLPVYMYNTSYEEHGQPNDLEILNLCLEDLPYEKGDWFDLNGDIVTEDEATKDTPKICLINCYA
jgi:hypothetical protein